MELEVMARVGHHDSLLTLREAFVEDGNLYLVTDVMETDMCELLMQPGGGHRSHWSELDVCRFMFSLLKGLAHLHSYGIAHRDVKLDNIMLRRADDPSSAHLGDFGLAAVASKASGAVGSLQYIAPEVLVSKEGQDFYGTSADMWSAGVVLYATLGRSFPFGSKRKDATVRKIHDGSFDFNGAHWANVSNEAKSLIHDLLVVDPTSRLTAHQALRHPWFASVSAEEAKNRARAKSADGRFWLSGVRDIMQQLAGLINTSSSSERSGSSFSGMKSRRSPPPSDGRPPPKSRVPKLPPITEPLRRTRA